MFSIKWLVGLIGWFLLVSSVQAQDGWGRLHDAVDRGNLGLVRQLILTGHDVNAGDDQGWTPLMMAAYRGKPEIAKILIEYGANLDAQNLEGWNALMVAAFQGHEELTQLLIENQAKLNLQNEKGFSALMLATLENQAGVVKQLLKAGADKALKSEEEQSALEIAQNRQLEEIQRLLTLDHSKVQVQVTEPVSPDEYEKQRLKDLLQNLDNEPASSEENATQSAQADQSGQSVESDQLGKDQPSLLQAAFAGDLYQVVQLLDQGAYVDQRFQEGWTALMAAAHAGDQAMVQLLLKHKAFVDAVRDDGATPLILGAYSGNVDVVEALLKAGATVDITDHQGWSALMLASYRGFTEAARLLLEQGADPLLQEKQGDTALHLAAEAGRTQTLKVLLEHGADPKLINHLGETPVDKASRFGHSSVAHWLQNPTKTARSDSVQPPTPQDSDSQGVSVRLKPPSNISAPNNNSSNNPNSAAQEIQVNKARLAPDTKPVNHSEESTWLVPKVGSANLRSSPGEEPLAQLYRGTRLKALERQNNWFKVEVLGWVHSSLILNVKATEAKADQHQAQDLAIVAQDRVILRSKPDGAPLGSLRQGMQLTVLDEDGPWRQALFYGWVHSSVVWSDPQFQ